MFRQVHCQWPDLTLADMTLSYIGMIHVTAIVLTVQAVLQTLVSSIGLVSIIGGLFFT